MVLDVEYILSIVAYMLIIIVGGAFGGYVSAIFDVLKLNDNHAKKEGCAAKCERKYFYCRALIGICGAFGVVLIGGWVEKINLSLDLEGAINLIALCVISGIVSYRLLPVIGYKLQKQIDALQMTAESQNQNIANLRDDNQKESLIQDVIPLARDLLADNYNTSSDVYSAILLMEKVKGSSAAKFQRIFHIYLGRLYRRIGDYDKAIDVLRDYIRTLERESELPAELKEGVSTNKAAALYNIACYHVLKAHKAQNSSTSEEISRLFGEALGELEKSLSFDPQYWKHAINSNEKDFDVLLLNNDLKSKFDGIIEVAKAKTQNSIM